MTIYFLGGGNMAEAIISGLTKEGTHQVHVVNRGEAKRQALAEKYNVSVSATLPELSAEDVLILAVKPQDLAAACEGIDPNGALVVSVAAGINMATLQHYLNGHSRIIRAMPNTPAAVGLGVTGLYADQHIVPSDKNIVEHIMRTSGLVVWLPDENAINHITAISGSGPAYVFYLMQALQQAAETLGFAPETAREIVLATFEGGVALAKQSGEPFTTLENKVTSKGGTTYEALQVFKQQHMANTITEGVKANVARSKAIAAEFEVKENNL